MRLGNPSFTLFLTLFLSFFMWLFPDFSILRSGFRQKAELLSIEGIILIIIYIFFILIVNLGFKINIKYKNKFNDKDRLDNNRIYYIFILISIIGVMTTYYELLSKIDFFLIKEWLFRGVANNLRYILYEDYSFGLISLRYVIGETFSLMLIRRYIYKKKSYFDILVLLEMISIVIISNRLLLIFSILSFCIYWSFNKKIKITLKTIVLVFMCIFIIFLLTYSRTKNYYLYNYNLGFIGAGISEIKTYLGSPFQGALTTISMLINKETITLERFYFVSTIQKNLTTNSAIYDLVFNKGIYSTLNLILILSIFFVVLSFVIRFLFLSRKTALFFSYATLMYSIAEFWRLFIFFNGVIIVLFIIPIFVYYLNKIFK